MYNSGQKFARNRSRQNTFRKRLRLMVTEFWLIYTICLRFLIARKEKIEIIMIHSIPKFRFTRRYQELFTQNVQPLTKVSSSVLRITNLLVRHNTQKYFSDYSWCPVVWVGQNTEGEGRIGEVEEIGSRGLESCKGRRSDRIFVCHCTCLNNIP